MRNRFKYEVFRMGFDTHSAWRISDINNNYRWLTFSFKRSLFQWRGLYKEKKHSYFKDSASLHKMSICLKDYAWNYYYYFFFFLNNSQFQHSYGKINCCKNHFQLNWNCSDNKGLAFKCKWASNVTAAHTEKILAAAIHVKRRRLSLCWEISKRWSLLFNKIDV